MELELPVAVSGEDDIDQQVPRVTINVKSDGSLWLAGRPIAADQLKDRLQAAREKEGDDIEVRIRSSRSAPYSTVEPIMLACTSSQIWNVTFAVYRERQP